MNINSMKDERIRKKCVAIAVCMLLLIIMLVAGVHSGRDNEKGGKKITAADAFRLLGYLSAEDFSEYISDGDYVTVGEGREIYAKLCNTPSTYPIKGKGDKKKLTEAEWIEIYKACVNNLGMTEQIYEENYTVIGAVQGQDNQVFTDKGLISYEGLDMLAEKYRSITYLMAEGMAVFKITELEETTTVKNLWIEKSRNDTLEIFTEAGTIELTGVLLGEEIAETVADISFAQGEICNVALKKDLIHGKVLSLKEDGVEIEGYGLVKYDESFAIYKTYGELSMGQKRDLVVGYDLAEFVVGDGKLCAALVRKTPDMQNIRVLIKSSSFGEIFHDTITMEVTEETTVKYGETEKTLEPGERLTLTADSECMQEGRVYVTPVNSTGRILLTSVQRDCGITGYRGKFEVSKVDGRLIMVNELLLEEYLYDVVPSEMPSSYSMEALKVQAVCARSYAYNQILYNGCAQYGAHVDDSVSYQVYHNVAATENTVRAVKETCGQVAVYGDSVIDAYYYSTSCGITTDAGIWDCAEEKPYIASHTVNEKNEYVDLTSEESFSDFIKWKSYDAYDNDISWYRWKTRVSIEQIKRNIDQNMMSRYEANPKNILTKNQEGEFESVPVDTVGTVKSIHITKRGKGGVATEMIIKGSLYTVKVLTEYNIRIFLAPVNSNLTRNDGSKVDSLTMLPSAFTTALPVVDEEDNTKVVAFEMEGGGYGHGAGMSQNGANSMAKSGMGYEEILKFYYQGIELKTLY